jgi:prepilin-type N-terminal cleavage/methylation domain-containing protein
MSTQYSTTKERGFTLIEMLIAVFIFTVSISALTYMAGRGIRVANDAQQRITAEYLALEGIEVVRNVRDSAFLSSFDESNWTNVFGDISGPGNCFYELGETGTQEPCAFSYNNGIPQLEDCPTDDCRLFIDTTNKVYTYNASGSRSPYTREIYLTQIDGPEIKVEVIVEWGNERIEYQEHLFLWG